MATREYQKVATLTVTAGGTEPFKLDVDHNGTYSRFAIRAFNGAEKAAEGKIEAAIDHILLNCTMDSGDSFPILNNVTPDYLNARQGHHYDCLDMVVPAHMLVFDPAAGAGKDEAMRNALTYGTLDVTSLEGDVTFAADVTGVTRIEIYAEIDFSMPQALGDHIRIGSQNVQLPAAGGKVEINTIPFGSANLPLAMLALEEPTKFALADWTLSINAKEFPFRDTPQDIIEVMQAYCYRTKQDGFAMVDFNKEDWARFVLEAGKGNLIVTPNVSAEGDAVATSAKIWFEQIYKAPVKAA